MGANDPNAFTQSSADTGALIQSSTDPQVFGQGAAGPAPTPLPAGVWWLVGFHSASNEYRLCRMAANGVNETYRLPAVSRLALNDMRAYLAGTHPDRLYLLVRNVNDASKQVLYRVDGSNCIDGEEMAITKTVDMFTDSPWFEDFEYVGITGTHLTGLFWETRRQRNSNSNPTPGANFGKFDQTSLEPILSTTVALTEWARAQGGLEANPFAHDPIQEVLLETHSAATGLTGWRADTLNYEENVTEPDLTPAYDDSPKGTIQIHRFGSGAADEGILYMQDTDNRIRTYEGDFTTQILSVDPGELTALKAATGLPFIVSRSTVTSKTDRGTATIDLCDPESDCTPTNAYSEILVTHTLPTALQANFEIAGAFGRMSDTTDTITSGFWTNVPIETEASCWVSFDGDICSGTGDARKAITGGGNSATFKFISNKAGVNAGNKWNAGNATQIILLLKPK